MVVVVHLLAVILLPLMSSVIQPGGILVTIFSELVKKNGQVGVVLVGMDGMSVGAGPPKVIVPDIQGKGNPVVVIGIPMMELGSGHLGNGGGEAVGKLMPGRIESPIFGNQVDDSEPDK